MSTSNAPSADPVTAAREPSTAGSADAGWRQKILIAAAVGGGILGGLFSADIGSAMSSLWSNYVVPAYFEIFMSGIPFCG